MLGKVSPTQPEHLLSSTARRPPVEGELHAFLLFNVRERERLVAIERGLRDRRIATWYDDRDLMGGDEWQPREEEALRRAATVVVFLGNEGWGARLLTQEEPRRDPRTVLAGSHPTQSRRSTTSSA